MSKRRIALRVGRFGARRQHGCLRQHLGMWRASYRVDTPSGDRQRRSFTIGPIAQITEAAAREILRQTIERSDGEWSALQGTGQFSHISFLKEEHESSRLNRGAISELAVACDMLQKGFHVYRAVSPAATCDLIAMKGDERPVRIEVKTAFVMRDGRARVELRKKQDKFDLLAVVFRDGRIEYRQYSELRSLRFPLDHSVNIGQKSANQGCQDV